MARDLPTCSNSGCLPCSDAEVVGGVSGGLKEIGGLKEKNGEGGGEEGKENDRKGWKKRTC